MAYREYESQRNRNRDRDRIRYDLIEPIGVLSTRDNGWRREVNIVAWNGGAGKVDIREWDPNHERMTKGVTLFEEEAETLAIVLADRYGLRLKSTFAEKTAPPGGSQSIGRTFMRPSGSQVQRDHVSQEETIPFDQKPETLSQEDIIPPGTGDNAMAVAENQETDGAGDPEGEPADNGMLS